MFSTLMVCLALTGRLGLDHPQPPDHRLQGLQLPGQQKEFDRTSLERTKRCRIFLEESIEMYEKDLKEYQSLHQRFPSIFTPDQANRDRNHLELLRGWLKHEKKMEEALECYLRESEVNPGSATERALNDRLDKQIKEHEAWLKAWDRGLIAPPPREKK